MTGEKSAKKMKEKSKTHSPGSKKGIIIVIIAILAVSAIIAIFVLSGNKNGSRLVREGIQLMQNRSYEDAARKFYEAVKQNPDNEDVYIHLSNSLLALRRDDEAYSILMRANKQFPDSYRIHLELGRFYILNRQNEKAREELKKAWELNSTDPTSIQFLGTIYMNEQRIDEAYDTFKQLLDFDPEASELNRIAVQNAYLYLLEIIGNQGKTDDEALSIINNAESHLPQDKQGRVYVAKGLYYYKTGSLDESLKNFQKAIEIAPAQEVWANLPIAEIYNKKGDTSSALKHYRVLLGNFSDPDSITTEDIGQLSIYGGIQMDKPEVLNTVKQKVKKLEG